jgi:hypothetical protein
MPGGSNWGFRDGIGPANDAPSTAHDQPACGCVSASAGRVLALQPVELTVRLSASQPIDLPDVIDPGYEQFDIWIESRRGRRSRAPALCANGARSRGPRQAVRAGHLNLG